MKGINDLRPLSLTNFEYRIYTKILVNRFNKLGPMLFSDCQTCSVKGRRINDSINTIKDIIEDANIKNNEAFLTSIDQRKAFDSFSHLYLFYLLDYLNISLFLNNSVKRIYRQSYAYICVNRVLSKIKIKIKRGIKQGCALSMFLYTLGIEELLIRISKNSKIIGYPVPMMTKIPNTIKGTGYADDIGCITRTLESIDFIFDEFKKWGSISGASINEEKTKILALNSNHTNYRGLPFVKKLKILGVIFDKQGVSKDNLDLCFKKISNTINMWNNVKLNMLEKITVLRTFALSKLWYHANFYVLNEKDIKSIEDLTFKFIWNGCELIKRDTLIANYNEGGLKMISIRAKLQTIMIRNFMYIKRNLNRPQYQLSVYWLKFHLREYLTNFNIIPGGSEKDRPIFFKKMIASIESFKILYRKWALNENEKRKRICEIKNLSRKDKQVFKPVEKNFLENFRKLTSKFIYNNFIENFRFVPRISYGYTVQEQEKIFLLIQNLKAQDKVKIVNYKLLLNGLPLNKKFKNRYDKKCYLCKRTVDEDTEHLFVSCKIAKKFYDYTRERMIDNSLDLCIELVIYKPNLKPSDYAYMSNYVFSIWQTRNILKHSKDDVDGFNIFKNIFNKWSISITNI